MADITKCTGGHCKFKEECHRFVAPASERQSYFPNPPFFVMEDGERHDCEHFWGVNGMTREYAKWYLNNKEQILAEDELRHDMNFKYAAARNPDDLIMDDGE